MALTGTRILLVGGSAGIGRAIGLRAAKLGAEIVYSARRLERLTEVVAEAGSGHAVTIDVTDDDSVVSGVGRAVELLGGLDVVVYASGVASISPILDETRESWRRMFETNVIGAAAVVRESLPHLADRGIVFFCSSTNTHRRLWGLTGYGATKAAFDRLIEGMRDEHPEYRFVRAVIGSTIGTEFGAAFDGEVLGHAFPRWVVTGQQTAGMMQPDELAAVVGDVLVTLRNNPGVEIPHLPLDPAGGMMTLPPTPEMAAKVFESIPADDEDD